MVSQSMAQPLGSNIVVDVSKNFDFVTNFGTYKISTLMQEYIFEGVFVCLSQFLSLRIPMNGSQRELIRKLLKLCLMCVAFKSKPSHEKNIINFINEVRNCGGLAEVTS